MWCTHVCIYLEDSQIELLLFEYVSYVIKRRNDLVSKNIISSLIKLMEFDFYTLKIDHVECTDR